MSLAYILPGEHFNPMLGGVIRYQCPKIHRFRLVSTSTVGGPFRKISNIDCKVIQHARASLESYAMGKTLFLREGNSIRICFNTSAGLIGFQPTKTRAELDSSTSITR